MQKNKPIRLIFLDMMRFIALFMMIQGHTVYAMLDREIRDGNSPGIQIWTMFRGYTAPFFMVIAGAVFTFLLLQQDRSLVTGNVRIRKGLLRVATLLFWGYMLRFQFEFLFRPISQSLFENMIAVDVLHIIGFGLLTVIGVFIFTRKQIGLLAFAFLGLFFVVSYSSPYISRINCHQEEGNFISYDRLGVHVIQNNEKLADSLGIFESDGALVQDVRPGSQAESLGFQKNDVIVAIGWEYICSLEEIQIAESRQKKGQYADFDLVRGKERVNIPYNYEFSLDAFPKFFTFWLNSSKTKAGRASSFPIFPWLSYIMFGAFFGALLAWMKDKGTLFKALEFKLILIGSVLIGLSEVGDIVEVNKYGVSNFWGQIEYMGASTNLIFHRIGVVMLVGAVCAFLSRFITRLPKIMNQMSRNTLWLYVGHLIILYWIRPAITQEFFGLGMTLTFVFTMYVLMVLQTLIIEEKNKFGSWKLYLQHLGSLLNKKIKSRAN